MRDSVRIYMIVNKTEVLGPGKRFGIWVQGCNKRCKGCIAKDSWNVNGGYEESISTLANKIIHSPDIEGITISGGEPFLQQECLLELIQQVRKQKDIGVIIYTGMKYEEIKNTDLAKNADIIIDGEYIEELNDDKSLRGSSNQNVICITDRYKNVISEHYGIQGRKIEINVSGEIPQMVGIPSKNQQNIFVSGARRK